MASKGSFSRYQSYTTQKKRRDQFFRVFLVFFLVYVGYLVVGAAFVRTVRWNSVTMEPTLAPETSLVMTSLPLGTTNLPFLPFGLPGWRGPEHGELVEVVPPYHSPATPWVAAADDLVRFLTLNFLSLDASSRPNWDKEFVLRRVIALPGDTVKLDHFTAQIKPKNEAYFLSEYELSKTSYSIAAQALPTNWKSTFPLGDSMPERLLGPDEYFVLADNRTAGEDSRSWGVIRRTDIKASALLVYWPFERFGGL